MPLQLDLAANRCVRDGDPIDLTPRETEVLAYLSERPGQTISQTELERQVWGFRAGVRSKAVPVGMRRLRAKLEPDPKAPKFLINVHGAGWRLDHDTPAPKATRRRSGRIPRYATPYVSLSDLEARVMADVRRTRLVTLCGQGGAGKTRLASEVAHQWSGPTWFVDLTAQSHAMAGLCAALGVSDPREVRDQLPDDALIVLDNIEHLLESAVEVSTSLIAETQAHVLVTGRRALGVLGECIVAMPRPTPVQALQLFRQLRPHRGPDEAQVERLIAAVDGLPLALELCAATRRPLGELLALLDRGDLAGIAARAPTPRQSSLDALVSWSWSLLEPDLRQALVIACSFPSTVDVALVQAVLGDRTEDHLRALAERSLLRHDASGSWSHFPVVRAFGATRPPDDRLRAALRREARSLIDSLLDEPVPTLQRLHALHDVLRAHSTDPDRELAFVCARALDLSFTHLTWTRHRAALLREVIPRLAPLDTADAQYLWAHAHIEGLRDDLPERPERFVEPRTAFVLASEDLISEIYTGAGASFEAVDTLAAEHPPTSPLHLKAGTDRVFCLFAAGRCTEAEAHDAIAALDPTAAPTLDRLGCAVMRARFGGTALELERLAERCQATEIPVLVRAIHGVQAIRAPADDLEATRARYETEAHDALEAEDPAGHALAALAGMVAFAQGDLAVARERLQNHGGRQSWRWSRWVAEALLQALRWLDGDEAPLPPVPGPDTGARALLPSRAAFEALLHTAADLRDGDLESAEARVKAAEAVGHVSPRWTCPVIGFRRLVESRQS